ncbi:unnamed protein product [Gordionus sp. m RMFG-2023]
MSIGLSIEKANQTIKNEALTRLLKSSIEKVKEYGEVDKPTGIFIYNLVTKIKPQIKNHLSLLLDYIGSKRITNDVQLNAALEYLLTSSASNVDINMLEKNSGIGVTVSPEEIELEVEKALDKYKKDLQQKRYKFNTGIIIGEVRKHLKWAEGKNVKSEIDIQILNLLGPKTDDEILVADNQTIPSYKKSGPVNVKRENVKTFKSNLTTDHLGAEVDLKTRNDKIGDHTNDDDHLGFYRTLNFHKPGENYKTDGYVITPHTPTLLKEHLERTGSRVVTRFPPEPNGILHVGHAKAINIDFGYAQANDGICYLRYDDTNPEKEEEKFFLGIEEMVSWLGYTPYRITHSSDYFNRLYLMAVRLIEKGLAYVCHQSSDEMKGFDPAPSPWKDRDVVINLTLFEDMKKGKIEEGMATLRMKVTLEEGKIDPVAYRIKFVPHHRTKYDWCIYPTYDFTHCLCDCFEDITHSLCTKEFQSRRSSYYWLCNALDLYCPVQWEYGRLNMTHSVVSKRKIAKLIEAGVVKDWDDPRLYTLTALKRRGYPPSAINKFCLSLGVTTALTNVDIEMLESFVRDELNYTAKRAMVVLEPLKVTIVNWDEIKTLFPFEASKDSSGWLELNVPDFPVDQSRGSHVVRFGANIYIERSDFKNDADKSFRRLTLKQSVGLRYANIVIDVLEIIKFPSKENVISQLKVKARAVAYEKPKSFIHWVSDPMLCEIRLYEKLFIHKNPDNLTQVPDGFLSDINPNSVKTMPHALADKSVKGSSNFDKFQFERVGYFSVDPDSKLEKMVFNRCVSLKEDSKK